MLSQISTERAGEQGENVAIFGAGETVRDLIESTLYVSRFTRPCPLRLVKNNSSVCQVGDTDLTIRGVANPYPRR